MEHMDALMRASATVPWTAFDGAETHYSAPVALTIGAEQDGEVPITGMAVPFDKPDSMGRVIKSGAFNQSLARSKGRMPILLEHDTMVQIGIATGAKVSDGALQVSGVLLPEIRAAADQLLIMRAGATRGLSLSLSIGWRGPFEYVDDQFVWTKADLMEWSIVRFPAFTETHVEEASAPSQASGILSALQSLSAALRR